MYKSLLEMFFSMIYLISSTFLLFSLYLHHLCTSSQAINKDIKWKRMIMNNLKSPSDMYFHWFTPFSPLSFTFLLFSPFSSTSTSSLYLKTYQYGYQMKEDDLINVNITFRKKNVIIFAKTLKISGWIIKQA